MWKACFFRSILKHYIFILHSHYHLVSIDTCDAVTVQRISTDLSEAISILVCKKKFFFGAAKKAGTINKFNHKKQNKMNSDFTPTTQCDVNVILLNFLWCDPFLFLTRCHRLRILTPKNVKAIPSDRLTFAYHFVPLIWNFSFFKFNPKSQTSVFSLRFDRPHVFSLRQIEQRSLFV